MRLLVGDYNIEDKIIIGSANNLQNKRIHKYFPKSGNYLSRLDLYLFLFVGYFELFNKYWDKFSTVEAPIDYYGISVYKKYLKVSNKLDKPLFIWGANEKDVIQKLVKDGVAGIMTDRPDLF